MDSSPHFDVSMAMVAEVCQVQILDIHLLHLEEKLHRCCLLLEIVVLQVVLQQAMVLHVRLECHVVDSTKLVVRLDLDQDLESCDVC